MKILDLKILKTKSCHKDIEFNLYPEVKVIADSYYITECGPEDSIYDFFISNIQLLIDSIEHQKTESCYFFPIDLSDQYTGFICFKKINIRGMYNVFYITTKSIHGYNIDVNFNPSFNFSLDKFLSIEGGIITSKTDLISDLNTIQNSLKSES